MATRAVVPVAGGGGDAEARGRRRGNGGQIFTNPAARVHACPPGWGRGQNSLWNTQPRDPTVEMKQHTLT
eukprot:6699234-Prymnesium_polylepis.1